MKVYVLGAKGMLGRYVETYFRLNGYDVVGFSRYNIDASNVDEKSLNLFFFNEEINKGDVIIVLEQLNPK